MLLALLFAAIITERNGTFADVPSNAAESVSSPYIPYGTYTDGSGSTEYLRVGTNLVGAVASAIDGLWERVAIPYGWLPDYLAVDECAELQYPLRETCRSTRRILANALNFDGSGRRGEGFTDGLRSPIEQTLADYYLWEAWSPERGLWVTNATHMGIAGGNPNGLVNSAGLRFPVYDQFTPDPVAWSSRTAESLFTDGPPPISSEWTAELPFQADRTNDWQSVFPAYLAYEYDEHFFKTNENDFVAQHWDYTRWHLRRWMRPAHLDHIWGSDVWGSEGAGVGRDLDGALQTIPVATNALLETVLSVDTGWKYEVPPVETGSYWTVSGPLGNFRLSEYYEQYHSWDNYSWPYPTNYYLTLGFDDSPVRSAYTLYIYDITSSEAIFYGYAAGDEDSDDLNLGGYHAQRTRLVSDADDYTHWRNMTRRFDWKRLGIICQLERQMEITYRAREREDYLPLWEFYVSEHRDYTGAFGPVHVKITDGNLDEFYLDGHKDQPDSRSLKYTTWTLASQFAIAETNRLSASYPTARGCVYLSGVHVYTRDTPSSLSGEFTAEDYNTFTLLSSALESVDPQPTGRLHFRVDIAPAVDGPRFSAIWVTLGGTRYFPAPVGLPSICPYTIQDTETVDTFTLVRDDAKVARDITTMSNNAGVEYGLMGRDIPAAYPEMTASAVSNLESCLWANYIKRISLPTLEVRLASTNDYWASQIDAEPAMPYLYAGTDYVFRAFRYLQVAGSDLDDFRGERLLSLRDLDAEVKRHFGAISGRNITAGLNGRAQFTTKDISELNRAISAADVVPVLDIQPSFDEAWMEGQAHFGAIDHFEEGDTVDLYTVLTGGGVPTTNHWTVVYTSTNYNMRVWGSWSVSLSAGANVAITNSGVRVDGHQNQMMKTLWKFKNLRDPDL